MRCLKAPLASSALFARSSFVRVNSSSMYSIEIAFFKATIATLLQSKNSNIMGRNFMGATPHLMTKSTRQSIRQRDAFLYKDKF